MESELAERGLIIFSADVVADDWHRDITPAKITALAMSRLEARGKGILLLHDIHAKTVAALPGLLQQLKEQGFRVVQVVPSAAYEMAMARKPAARMLASAMPGELMIEDNDAARPIWPHAADDPTPDAAVLPVPDAAAFEPDADLADDSGAVRWPDIPQSVAAQPAPSRVMRKGKHTKVAAHPERRKRDVAGSADRKRAERDRRPEHSAGSCQGRRQRPPRRPLEPAPGPRRRVFAGADDAVRRRYESGPKGARVSSELPHIEIEVVNPGIESEQSSVGAFIATHGPHLRFLNQQSRN